MDIQGTAEGYLLEAFAKKAEASVSKGQPGKEDSKLKQVCEDFESVLLNYMFQSMKKTVGESGLFDDSFQKNMYESLFFENISQKIAEERGMGIGDSLYRQLSRSSSTVENDESETGRAGAEPVEHNGNT